MATTATGTSTLELVKQAYQLFGEGNIPALMELYHQDGEWEIMGASGLPFGGTYKGKEQILGFLQKLNETIQFTKYEVKEFIAEGDKVVGIIDCEGIARATGKPFKTATAHLITAREGKLFGLRDFVDTLVVYKALQ